MEYEDVPGLWFSELAGDQYPRTGLADSPAAEAPHATLHGSTPGQRAGQGCFTGGIRKLIHRRKKNQFAHSPQVINKEQFKTHKSKTQL